MPSVWFVLSQVNGVLPILPLLFPVLWVLATACGEARVLAQMSKASPSSLVGSSKASWGQYKKKQKSGAKRCWLCPSEQVQRSSPTLGPVHEQALGNSACGRAPRLGPGRQASIHPGIQMRGFGDCPGVLKPKASGALRGWGTHPCILEAYVRVPP